MVLDKLILENFLTYDFLEYSFEKKPLLVQGINLTDDYQKSNGTGKSGMQTGIEFCLTASNSRDVRDKELITFGKKKARVQLFASCGVRKQSIHIDWTINLKGSNKLVLKTKYFSKDVWEDVSFSNINDGKKFISNWFAISKEDLFNYYIINKTRFKSFFKSSNREKVDLINRFSDASIIEGLENIDTQKEEEKILSKKDEIKIVEGKLELLQEQIQEEKDRDFKEELEEKKESINDELLEIDEDIQSSKDKIKDHKKEISLSLDFIKEDKEDIEKILSQKLLTEKDIEFKQKSLKKIDSELESLKEKVDNFVKTDWKNKKTKHNNSIEIYRDKISNSTSSLSKIDNQKELIQKLIQKINIKLDGVITCPKCSHKFLLSKKEESIDSLKSKESEAKSLLKKFEEKEELQKTLKKELSKNIDKEEGFLSKILKQESVENDLKNSIIDNFNEVREKRNKKNIFIDDLKNQLSKKDIEIERCNSSIKNHKRTIDFTNQSIKTIKESIESLEKEKLELIDKRDTLKKDNNTKYINTLKKNLSALEVVKTAKNDELENLNDAIYELNQWKNNFKKFRMFIANQSLRIIEYHNNRYLKDMDSDLRVKIEGFKEMSDGRLKEEIVAKVIRDTERTFSSFSGGERGRLLFASILANRHMINETHPYGGLDFLSIDEVFEGIDSTGLEHLIKSVKNLQITVMIITHIVNEDIEDNILTIVKENGISTIKN